MGDFFMRDNKVRLPKDLDYNLVKAVIPKRLSISLYVIIIFTVFLFGFRANAANIVTYSVSDSIVNQSERLEMHYKSISNENARVRISFELKSANSPFTIYKVYYSEYLKEWRNGSMYPKKDKEENKKLTLMLPIQIKDVINEYVFVFDLEYVLKHPELLK